MATIAPTTIDTLIARFPAPTFQLLTDADGPGQHSGQWDYGGERRETLTFKADFDLHESLLALIAGTPQSYGTGSGTKITRSVPMVYPYNPRLYAIGASWRGSNANADPTKRICSRTRPYASRIYTVTFGTLPFIPEVSDQPFQSYEASGGFEVRTIPGMNLTFSNTEKIDQDMGRIVGTEQIRITLFQIPDIDAFKAVADPLKGTINASALLIRKTLHAAGTVLFVSYDSREVKLVSGQINHEVTLNFLECNVPWNSAIRSDGVVDTYTPATYPTADLSPLFKFGT